MPFAKLAIVVLIGLLSPWSLLLGPSAVAWLLPHSPFSQESPTLGWILPWANSTLAVVGLALGALVAVLSKGRLAAGLLCFLTGAAVSVLLMSSASEGGRQSLTAFLFNAFAYCLVLGAIAGGILARKTFGAPPNNSVDR